MHVTINKAIYLVVIVSFGGLSIIARWMCKANYAKDVIKSLNFETKKAPNLQNVILNLTDFKRYFSEGRKFQSLIIAQ